MKRLLILVTILVAAINLHAQTKLENEIRQVVLKETESYIKMDSAAWHSVILQDSSTFRSYSGFGFHWEDHGWNAIKASFGGIWSDTSFKPRPTKVVNSNFFTRISGNVAWISYRQNLYEEGKDSLPYTSTRESRTLVKEKNQWKIASIMTIDSLSYTSTRPANVENIFNMSGYNFLAAKKVKEAIEIFKLNVSLYPDAWNVYDSLGEAYAADGNKQEAIRNYQRSVELNPKNASGAEILKKLQGQ